MTIDDELDRSEEQFAASLGCNDDDEQFGSATLPATNGARIQVSAEQRAVSGLERRMAEERKLEQQAERWRDEVTSRIATYKEKRSRKQLAGEFSMRFDFDEAPAYSPRSAQAAAAAAAAAEWDDEPQLEEPASSLADALLAAETIVREVEVEAVHAPPPQGVVHDPEPEVTERKPPAPEPPRRVRHTNLIAFPRLPFMPPPPDELAEPVLDTPRILDVPEEIVQDVVGERPPLADIALESNPEEIVSRPEFDVPPQVAPLALRFAAALIDFVVVMVAAALFAAVAQTLAKALPHNRMALAVVLGAPAILFAAYQYLFLVYGGATLGMLAARLEIRRFSSEPAKAGRRRLRALAMVMSFASLGLGIFWAFADEDMLCWHDRITRTYLAKK
jgi:uncharacterized RDD family membrane protein YckC